MKNKIKLFEMFSGFGGGSWALKKAKIDFECVGISEIDKYAIQCYEQNHKNNVGIYDNYNKSFRTDGCVGTIGRHSGSLTNVGSFTIIGNQKIKNYGDCTKINPNDLPDFDLLTAGFPCQSFSVAGKGEGELDPRGTLFYDIIRIAEIKKPRWILLENVKGLINKNHRATFEKILSELDRIGYSVEWKVLNSKKYGIPQNRERVFFVCFRDSEDLENWEGFPKEEELKIFLKDILEENVDEKYYLKQEQVNKILSSKFIQERKRIQEKEYCDLILARDWKDPKCIQINNPTHSNNRVYSDEGLSPTINTMGGGNRQPFIVHNCITEAMGRSGSSSEYKNSINKIYKSIGVIRKLTPTECFRLMGFLNDEINLEGLSNTQKYRLAGNGFEINLVSKIFKTIFKGFR